ncbi:MAG: OB-fold putative lipoprotein [Patescibacteria group bacterium]|nr:OB-fold putative lipoprotein [Patescibacteria group bacterium]MCL5409876.1 OB-fold putative lipoprotein [Patescibacteria group bacterium]
MKKLLKIVGIVIVVIIVISVISSLGKSGNNQSSSNSGTQQQAKVQQEPTKVTAKELADDFDANQVAAESKWKGKLVEFSAEISNITDTGLSFQNVGSKQFSMAQISCRVADKQQLLPLKNGQMITVRGTVGNQTIGVIDVSDCQVVQ